MVSEAHADLFQPSFGQTREGLRLKENCDRYGFILRYPEDREDITHVRYEPWHLRYVGPEAAAYIMENSLTLEEFSALRIQALGAHYEEAAPFDGE